MHISSRYVNRTSLTNRPVQGTFYFEVCVLQPYVRIGVASYDHDIRGPLGTGYSYAYGCSNYAYHQSVRRVYGSRLRANDTVGVLKVSHYLKYFVNGIDMGIAYDDLHDEEYYPALSFHGGTVTVNFGPYFAYDHIIKYEALNKYM